MVSGDNFSDGILKTRPVLTDVTNRPQKRAFSLVSGDSSLKSGDGCPKTDANEGDSHFAKQVCLGLENLIKEKCKSNFSVVCDDKVLSLRKDKQPCGRKPVRGGVGSSMQNVSSDDSGLPSDLREEYHLLDSSVHIIRDNTKYVMRVGDTARDGCPSSVVMPACSKTFRENSFGFGEKGAYNEGGLITGVSQGRLLIEGLTDPASENDDQDQGVDKLASSKCGAIECSTISGSQDHKFPGLERCVGLKGDGVKNLIGSGDLLKDCTCCFCSTAAYIWSDLHYQDIKGRLSALKKSQREAATLVQKIPGAKDSAGQRNTTESSNLEFNLMDQWRSLFVHMENTLADESSQLESSFEKLKDLRESCKNDLEMMDKGHFDNH